MNKFVFILLFTTSLIARDNPFLPASNEQDIIYSTNTNESFTSFTQTSIKLPSDARIIKKVTIEYETLDASIESKSVTLNNSVDWHKPFYISQKSNDKRTIDAKTKFILKKKKPKVSSFKKVASFKYGTFFVKDKSMKIVTKDKIIRDFVLTNPHRVILDFKRDSSIKSIIKKLKTDIFTLIRIGNHDKYYRVVIELDGLYVRSTKRVSSGYIITAK